jgi:uncharacterized protein
LAGLLNTQHPGWSYSKPVNALATGELHQLSLPLAMSSLATFAGAISSSLLAGGFRWARFSALRLLRCLLGGTLMAGAAAMVPGGNDTLLLWAIPGLALYGLVAYGLMLGTIFVAFCASLLWPREGLTNPPAAFRSLSGRKVRRSLQ